MAKGKIPIGPFDGGQNSEREASMVPQGYLTKAENCSVRDGILRSITAASGILNSVTSGDTTAIYRFGDGETSADFFAVDSDDYIDYNGICYEKNTRANRVFFYASKAGSNFRRWLASSGNAFDVVLPPPGMADSALSAAAGGSLSADTYEYIVQYELDTAYGSHLSPPSRIGTVTAAANDKVSIAFIGTAKLPTYVRWRRIYRRGSTWPNFHLVDVATSATAAYEDVLSDEDVLGNETLQYLGFDCPAAPGGPWPGRYGVDTQYMPTPGTGTAGNVSQTDPEYCYTLYKTINSETFETAPSPVYKLNGSVSSKQVVFTFGSDAEMIPTGYTGARLYKFHIGADYSYWLKVDDQTSGTTLTDDTDDSALDPAGSNPPMANGPDGVIMHKSALVAWIGDTIYVAEPDMPTLWQPDAWLVRLPFKINRVMSFDNQLVAFTQGPTFRIDASSPDSLFFREIPGGNVPMYRTAAVGDAGVYFVKDGVSYYDGSRIRNLTAGKITEATLLDDTTPEDSDKWGIYHDGHYYVFGVTGTSFVLNVRNADGRDGRENWPAPVIRQLDDCNFTCGFSDPVNGKLYLGDSGTIYEWPDEDDNWGTDPVGHSYSAGLVMDARSPVYVPVDWSTKKRTGRGAITYSGIGRMHLYADGSLLKTYDLAYSSDPTTYAFWTPTKDATKYELRFDNYDTDGTTKRRFAVYPGGGIEWVSRGHR